MSNSTSLANLPMYKAGYKPSPQPNRTYNGPAVPVVYDPNWQLFTNLTQAQIAWFQAQPEWTAKVAVLQNAISN